MSAGVLMQYSATSFPSPSPTAISCGSRERKPSSGSVKPERMLALAQ